MRDDRETLPAEIVDSSAWENRNARFEKMIVGSYDDEGNPILRAHPFSGGERNAFFVNADRGDAFHDLSAVSGLDLPQDSRSFVLWDYDRDGDQDIALVNASGLSLQVFATQVPEPGNFIAVELEGGARPGDDGALSNRDAIGAVVTLTTASGRRLIRGLNAGEGFAAQNSKTLIIGLGKERRCKEIGVRWPSGRTDKITRELPAGQLLRLRESASGLEHSLSPYSASGAK